MTPFEVASKLGIAIDPNPGVGCIWNGRAIHGSIAVKQFRDLSETFRYIPDLHSIDYVGHGYVELFIGYRIRVLSDVELFHELAHVLMCQPNRIRKPDYGFHWVAFYDLSVQHRDETATFEENWEEEAVETLELFMLLACGYDEEAILALFRSYNKPETWEKGIKQPSWSF